jgi:hypothetical protein
MIHNIHFGRLREGYLERNNLVPGKTVWVLGSNKPFDASEMLLPQDVRNCTKCHADTAATCGAGLADCGIGQTCVSGKCENNAWKQPSAVACLTCHDVDDAYGHAQIMTAATVDGPVETCNVCHGEDADFAVDKVHNISKPYKAPYLR